MVYEIWLKEVPASTAGRPMCSKTIKSDPRNSSAVSRVSHPFLSIRKEGPSSFILSLIEWGYRAIGCLQRAQSQIPEFCTYSNKWRYDRNGNNSEKGRFFGLLGLM